MELNWSALQLIDKIYEISSFFSLNMVESNKKNVLNISYTVTYE